MTLEDLADLIRAKGANTNRRIDGLRPEVTGQLLNVQNDLLDVKQSLDLAETVAESTRWRRRWRRCGGGRD